ncbi:MAG TPA: hypothetical protein VKT81_17445 [Bryobacteraceae bacterium]|nr:hypothetical protein [Bryobacteraceae bacterium]
MMNIDVVFGGLNSAATPASKANQLSSLSAQSFTTFLSEALSDTLTKFGINPNSFQLTLTNQPGQTPATSPNPAASPGAAAIPAVPVMPNETVAPPVAPPVAAPALVAPAAVADQIQPAVSTPSSNSTTWYASNPADDAYWSAQPAAVQQLRGIDNLDERKTLGEQLAKEGYNIDVPIMIWGWDAAKVTAARESYGYTWVPSALQQQVSAAPGVSGGGITPYNPSNPPAGSIRV